MLHCGMGTIAYSGISITTKAFTTKAFGATPEPRRSANYKPNIWSFDFVQSLKSTHSTDVVTKTVMEKFKKEFMHSLNEEPELSKEHIVDIISKLGLSSVFPEFMKDSLDSIASNINNACDFKQEDILKTAQCSRLLRQHGYGYDVSQATEDGETIAKGNNFFHQNIVNRHECLDDNNHLIVLWFDVVHNIRAYEQVEDNIGINKNLVELAKLNFNITQAMLVEELKELSRWWNNLGLIENIDFSRDRLVESFLGSVGITSEPHHGLLRKCLTKVGTLILVIDDLYDIYGSLQELRCFTTTVERWDSQELQQLPEYIKLCFKTLQTTTAEIVDEIEKEKGYDHEGISFSLNTAWGDFCKALLTEASWYNAKQVPSLEEYLQTACMTSSGPLLSLLTLLCTVDGGGSSDMLKHKLRECQDLVHYISLIIRLSNDLVTSAVELERGDSPSSILCFMIETNVSEDVARLHVKQMISDTWIKINKEILSTSSKQQTCVNLIINMARVCQLFIYHEGDGLSAPNKKIRRQINDLLIEPMKLSMDLSTKLDRVIHSDAQPKLSHVLLECNPSTKSRRSLQTRKLS